MAVKRKSTFQNSVLSIPVLSLLVLTLALGIVTLVANQKEAQVTNSNASAAVTPLPPERVCHINAGSYTLTAAVIGTMSGTYSCSTKSSGTSITNVSFSVPLTFSVAIPKSNSGQTLTTNVQTVTLSQLCAGRTKQCQQLCSMVNCSATVVKYYLQGIYYCSPRFNYDVAAEGTAYMTVDLAVINPQNTAQICSGTATMQAPVGGILMQAPQ